MADQNRRKNEGLGAKAYEEAKQQADGHDPATRRKLAAQADVAPEILFFLAEDDDPLVRREVARNPATPRHADRMLANDDDHEVRSHLTEKIAALTPNLDSERRETVRKLTVDTLAKLAGDQETAIRAMLSEAIKSIPDAPSDIVSRVIETLARDQEISVSGPVLEHSPLLSDEVLVEIISKAPIQGAVTSIAKRADVSEIISDAVVQADDEDAIVALLRNNTAQIREDTLDQLIDAAPRKPSFHEPLVRRPALSAGSTLKLAKFVAVTLVQELQNRVDLDPGTSSLLSKELERRIEASSSDSDTDESQGGSSEREKAQRMHKVGKLTPEALAESVASGRRAFVVPALALLTELEEPIVHSMLNSHNPKAVAALAWKAGQDMEFAVQLQLRLGYIKEADVLQPTEDGAYPMSESDMEWQIDLGAEYSAS
ncbi:MAG: DUF2336 domain-containing protein [Rhodospirillaceae bacterium]|nr:DUF2336 domain-containing protein [Rhodospirillaceae bacterium]